MNTLFRQGLLLGLIYASLMVTGCSISEEKQPEEILQTTEQAEPVDKVVAQPAPAEAKQEITEPEIKEEPIVEVIPSKTEDSDLKVKPIPEPEVVEKPVTESKKVVKQPVAEQAKKESPTSGEKVVEEKASTPTVPVSTGPNHFVITAAKKDASHPHFGKGHAMGFVVNNEQGKEIVLERGKTYKIDVMTDPKHDVYISLKEIGWGSTPYSEGVEGMYTYKGTITINPTEKTPDTLYYSCRNHPYMGGKIHIVNPGETVKIAKTAAIKNTSPDTSKAQQVTKGDVNQKIMFADMLLKSKTSQSVLESNITEAVDLYNKAKQDLQTARDQLKAGDNAAAYKKADNAVALLKKSSKLVPNESELAHMKEIHKELQISLADFEASHKDSYERITKKQGADAAIDYDRKAVSELKASAAESAKKGDYRKANQDLEKAQRMITVAIHKMLNEQTIVYDLKFESAEEEYEYELKRFGGYEELIPIAVEQKKPAEGAKKLMESFLKKGQDLRDRAIKKAKEGDYPTAIAMMQDATKDVRRALRMIGVMQ